MARVVDLVGFDYQIECYVPEKKRRFGYFCLPLLWGDELIGRADAKVFRNEGRLLVKTLYLEPGTKDTDELRQTLFEGLDRFAARNECQTVNIEKTVWL
ncbi:MAG: winged helix DNA-binding domain-containing protein [Pseudomonadales bacterium]|nr:winged helix DNA-binding domain-containing protein [Pseudomonadales bacterium]